SNPVAAKVNGKDQIIFPGGDNYLYGLEPDSGKVIWKFNCNPPQKKEDEDKNSVHYPIATPVVAGDRLYVGLGVYPEGAHVSRYAHFLCVDITKTGDVSPKSLDNKDPANKGTAFVWAYGGPIVPRPAKGRTVNFGSTLSTAAVHDGFVYIAEE